ncbi:MAG TPA: hypothetical protein ENI89_02390 [Desulfobulbus sp.]|nr:hypothetical protein [Desulfobulbus sp.]
MTGRQQFLISVLARDRVGIIHDITRVIRDMEGDLADTRQQVLQGYFSMILFASFPAAVTAGTIRRQLVEAGREDAPFEVSVRPVRKEDPEPAPAADTYVLTARGQDRIGFLATVAGFCARNRINILDLSTMVSDGSYVMILLVDPGPAGRMETIRAAIKEFNRENDLSLVLQHHDIFRATNEIRML